MKEKKDEIIKIFSCKNRLKIIICLKNKQKTVSDIIKTCNISQSAISQHLNKLKKLNIVENYKKGRFVFYKLKDKKIGQIAQKILKYLNIK